MKKDFASFHLEVLRELHINKKSKNEESKKKLKKAGVGFHYLEVHTKFEIREFGGPKKSYGV